MPDAPNTDAATDNKDGANSGTDTTVDDKKTDKPDDSTPEVTFDGPFDEERAKRKIAAQAADKAKMAARLAELEKLQKERDEADMTEAQKAAARAEAAEKELTELKRLRQVDELAKSLEVPSEILTAADEAGMKAQAKAFKDAVEAATKKTNGPGGGKPQPRFTSGAGNDKDGSAIDYDAMATDIKSR